jgi:pilus assembly protein FimV
VEVAAVEELAVEEAVPAPAPAAGIDPALWEEVNTKLDLARAYLEMGDREGAREILQEVVQEGDDDQKADAQQLIAEAG